MQPSNALSELEKVEAIESDRFYLVPEASLFAILHPIIFGILFKLLAIIMLEAGVGIVTSGKLLNATR